MKSTFFLTVLIAFVMNVYAQKKSYDIVTYTQPTGWTEKISDGYISYAKIDGGSWAQLAVYPHRTSNGDINTDFDKDWNDLVAANRTISSPEKTKAQTEKDWTVMSGTGVWQYNGANVASILTVYSNNKVCVAILCNATAQPYLKEYNNLIGSLDLNAETISAAPGATNNTVTENDNQYTNKADTALTGLWCDNHLETSGYFNGLPQYSAGYFRREYLFKADGTYIFRLKNWSSLLKEILFAYETGTYLVQGNRLIVTPKQGQGGWWDKVGQQTSAWGKRIKASDYKLEKTTYTFEIKYYSGSGGYSLIINTNKDTERDGTLGLDGFSYSKFETGKSIIDNPPGFKTGVADKSFTSSATSLQQNTNNGITGTWLKSGNLRIGSGIEKQWGAGTGGYMTDEYIFGSNGSYQFYSKLFSMTIDKLVLIRESGNYKIENNILTILPVKSTVESYTKKDGVDKWGKLLAKENRPLEKTTYTFNKHFFEGIKEWNLVLQAKMPTNRDGPFSNNTTFTNAYYYTVPSNIHTIIDLP